MKLIRFLFIAGLYVMAVASFVIFVTSGYSWVQFRYLSTPAKMFVLPDRVINGPEDERKLMADKWKNGDAVRLMLESGEQVSTRTHLSDEKRRHASSEKGLPVLYKKAGDNKVKVITGLQEIDSPWIWLILWLGFSVAATYSRKLPVMASD